MTAVCTGGFLIQGILEVINLEDVEDGDWSLEGITGMPFSTVLKNFERIIIKGTKVYFKFSSKKKKKE